MKKDVKPGKVNPLVRCVECNENYVEEEGDEICRPCWDAFIKAANDRRIARIKAGWTVDGTGAIHPPNARLDRQEEAR